MGSHKLLIAGKAVRLHGSLISAEFRTQRVLCSDPWKFVALWLKRDHKNDALFYWEQAHNFYTASQSLPELSSPLTSYYCFLNATKALLSSKKISFSESHGVGGRSIGKVKSLDNEIVDFQGGGILSALCQYLEDPNNAGKEATLKDIFWQIPFIHRAFCLTYKGATDLFIPLTNPCFLRKDNSEEAWFQAEIDRLYINAHTKKVIEPGYQLFELDGRYEVRKKDRFEWSGHEIKKSIENLAKYHRKIRKRIIPIFSSENRWYLKKSVNGHDKLKNSQLVLMYAAMHRLSELSRYEPLSFSSHFNVNHNWLLAEFIKTSPSQYIYGIASEITGLEFIKPDAF